VAQRSGLDIHPASLRLITQDLRTVDRDLRADPEASRLFLDMTRRGSRRPAPPQRAGVFGRQPDFGRVVAQMQYGMYHHYGRRAPSSPSVSSTASEDGSPMRRRS
jgi:[protein-PII] uridylyltransferase